MKHCHKIFRLKRKEKQQQVLSRSSNLVLQGPFSHWFFAETLSQDLQIKKKRKTTTSLVKKFKFGFARSLLSLVSCCCFSTLFFFAVVCPLWSGEFGREILLTVKKGKCCTTSGNWNTAVSSKTPWVARRVWNSKTWHCFQQALSFYSFSFSGEKKNQKKENHEDKTKKRKKRKRKKKRR